VPRPLLADALAGPEPVTVAQAVERMQAIDAALTPRDGVACFNRLYLAVTLAVQEEIARVRFRDTRFLAALDVTFANLYLAALRDPAKAPKAWTPLLEARNRRSIAPLQFALAGMNAHINRDLPVALGDTWRRYRIAPSRRSPQYTDYTAVNRILKLTEGRVKREFATGALALGDEALGQLDDIVAMWNVERARDAAWTNGETLSALRSIPPLRSRYLEALDRMVGFAGRGMLRPLGA
jgi:Family of unknown function (DUF5995)